MEGIGAWGPKVLVIPSWYPDSANPIGGIFVAQQVRALRDQGVEVAVLFPAERYEGSTPVIATEDGILTARTGWAPVRARNLMMRRAVTVTRFVSVRLPSYRRRIEAALSLLLERGFVPDLIHVHALWPAAAAASVVAKRLSIPFVVTEHSEEYSSGTERMLVRTPGVLPLVLRPLARKAAAYVAVSEDLASRLTELRLAERVHVIPNVVPSRSAAPTQTVLPHRILHVSQLGPAKNIPLLLRAIAALRARRNDFVLEVGGDSPFRAEAERLARELGIMDAPVSFLGMLTPAQVQEALERSAFTVLSSIHENSSVAAAESLMAGRPLLTTACGGHVEYLDDTLGRVVTNEDVEALTEGLDWMLDHFADFDPAHLNAFAREHFSEQAVVARLLAVYREVLGG